MAAQELFTMFARALAVLATLCWAYQTVYLLVSFFPPRDLPQGDQKRRYGVLIAARNEEAVLPYLLQSIRDQDYPQSQLRIFVVADNCTDATAQVARDHGAVVWQRFNSCQVGKGYALAFLLEQMEKCGELEALDAFLVFDADNLLRSDYISQLDRAACAGFAAFCGYRNTKNFGDSWVSMASALWFLHDSLHLNASRLRLGTGCAVSGTGFGFTRQLLDQMGGWRFFTLTEDIEFDSWCAARGIKIGFCRQAMLYDEQPVDFAASWRQRVRWVQGGVQVSIKYAKALLRGLRQGGVKGWCCFETMTLGLWGYLLSGVSTGLLLLDAWLRAGVMGLAVAAALGMLGMVLWLFLLGAVTVLQAWDDIGGTAGQKAAAIAVFPLFMLTFAPIAISALFQKRDWKPIHHTVAVPIQKMKAR